MNECKVLAEEIISTVLVLDEDDLSPGTSILGACSLCALAVQLLCVSFVSYCQGHVGPLDLFFLERDLEQVHLYGAEPTSQQAPLAVRLQRLTCLDDMLESPVLVFTCDTKHVRRRLDLVATPEQILDIWGPGSIFAGSITDTVMRPPCIIVRGGVIFPTGSGNFHWDRRMRMASSPVSTSIDLRAEIRVGVVLENNNGACSQNLAAVRAKCAEYRRPLGTCEPFWLHDREREVSAQAGMYIVPQFITKSQKNDGISEKKRRMDELRSRKLDPAFLESTSGLQVSLCSGFAKRVKIRHLLADLLPLYADRYCHHYPKWTILRDTFRVEHELRRGDTSLLRKLAEANEDYLRTFCDLIEGLMSTLQSTGIDPTGKRFIVALFPSSANEPVESLEFNTEDDHFWTKVLCDTSTTSTFAYFTTSCLQLAGYGCRTAEPKWHGQVVFLETEVHRRFDLASKRYKASCTTWTLEHGHTYAIGPVGGTRRMILMSLGLQATVVRPSSTEDPRLMVRLSAIPPNHLRRMLLRPYMGRLQERSGPGTDLIAYRAFIMSREDTRLLFT